MKKTEKKLVNARGTLLDIRDELLTYSTLFKSFKDIETQSNDFYCAGLALARISKKLDKINDTLDRVSMEIPSL